MKYLLISFFSVIVFGHISSQPYTPTPENLKAREWFSDARFGLFIHWGPFSIPGSGEWVMQVRNISVKNYTRLKDFLIPFN
jgi:alpha-L-fucosidase